MFDRNSFTSAILFRRPNTFVSIATSFGNVCRTPKNKSMPPSFRNTLQVLGDSSVKFHKADSVNLK